MCSSGSRCMLFEQIGEAPSAQRLSPSVDEHLRRCNALVRQVGPGKPLTIHMPDIDIPRRHK